MKKKNIFAIAIIGTLCLSNMVIIASAEETTIDINLEQGWNLITIPVENDFMASTLADEITGCLSVSKWNNQEQIYETYIVGGPPTFDFQIEDGVGYYIDVTTDFVLTVSGVLLENVNVDVLGGVNLIGRYQTDNILASELMDSYENCVEIKTFNATSQTERIYTGPEDQDFEIKQCMGYFVKIYAISFEITLLEGMNFITIPVENDFMASTLAYNIPGCLSISKWDPAEQTWDTYIVGGPPTFDFQIEDGVGYCVDVQEDTSVIVEGAPLNNIEIILLEGKNLLGWYEAETTTASEVMNNTENCVEVSIFDAEEQCYVIYDSTSGEDFTINQGIGYFVKINSQNRATGPHLKKDCIKNKDFVKECFMSCV